jgi:histidinol-phosphate aminotransferase
MNDSAASIDPLQLARPDILALKPYSHASWNPALERLHANELPWRVPGDASEAGLNRYPEPQPAALVQRLAALYGVATDQLLVGRGSDEGIDLLTRAFCRAGEDAVLICPPTFGMYAVAARIQGAKVVEVPLDAARGFALDADRIIASLGGVKLVYLCTPNNPTGNAMDPAAIERVIRAAAGRALVVVDEAYAEFCSAPSWATRIAANPHVVVLRTLSKAHGLAGARIGSVLAAAPVIALLRRIIPPYALAQPTVEAALAALDPRQLEIMQLRRDDILRERARVAAALPGKSCVRRVLPSEANFVLVEFDDAGAALARIAGAGLIVRDFRGLPGVGEALRITIGTPPQNDRMLDSLT